MFAKDESVSSKDESVSSKSITFHRIKWENLTTTESAIPRIIGILKKFIVSIIKVIAIDVNP